MNITAGTLRGRKLQVPDLPGLRPTPAKVRQALFNILADVDGMRILDLFAGSGVMALEALSRGAASAISIEQQRPATRAMELIRTGWKLEEQWKVMSASVEKGLATLSGHHFDLIFADPPYNKAFTTLLPQWLDQHAISCELLVMEEAARVEPEWPAGWQCRQSRRYGDTTLHFLSHI
ncbi:16S rRNA (guanine(966)-N(2))-methyltransferase RsmD [Mariprofundus erugo]|uniref:16S rRNA (Guanine(966)-N(2))-methyltransferase RsmD n=1 Tax=Mariprofundus erugo TaxID=2528639 RepID=A0A5R9GV88_9PROT|nr:16S rRNA (guanine(966)-N(2))-methyltransferase RsmD [Mariprofundus erugo]TLS68709.1 16S rRNA (guanine(966)-N(2))-methyltransferase RsmD [Mariprofundus erugo]